MMQRRWIGVVSVVVAAAAWATTTGGGNAARQDSKYAGTQPCMKCHIDLARQWAGLDHSKALMRPGRAPAQAGCEACHGPGGRHAAKREWRGEIISWKGMPADEQVRRCLSCHMPRVTLAGWKTSPHAKLGSSCSLCHEVHRPTGNTKNIQQPQRELCGGCHAEVLDAAKSGKHHALPKGLECTACHDPHAQARPKLLRAERKVLCAKCHAPKGPRVRPSSHNDTWFQAHGKTAKADMARCDTCHSREEFCNGCHGLAMPHADDWVTKHGASAQKSPATCETCHDKPECRNCHEGMPPASHRQETFRKGHSAQAKGHEALCNLCHGKNACDDCHGTKMPHPENWVMEHKQKGASFAANSLCFKCHQKAKFCVTCHPDK